MNDKQIKPKRLKRNGKNEKKINQRLVNLPEAGGFQRAAKFNQQENSRKFKWKRERIEVKEREREIRKGLRCKFQ